MVNVGLIGTGFVARLRALALAADGRGKIVAVVGHRFEEGQSFAQAHGARAFPYWQEVVTHPEVDLVMVCHINRDHSQVAAAALAAHKHVVVEYPLALSVTAAEDLIALALANRRLLHVEHIELLGGTHRALKEHLAQLGQPLYARYSTLSPKHPAPDHWTYQPELFGFPLIGALSRLHRVVDGFGAIERVYCQNHYTGLIADGDSLARYRTCLCTAQLTFTSGVIAEVVYGKGEGLWGGLRRFEVWGQQGYLCLDGDQGQLTNEAGCQPISVGSRQGLFAADTTQVLDYLLLGHPLYTTPAASVYSLRVAAAAEQSALTGQAVAVRTPEGLFDLGNPPAQLEVEPKIP